jgi:hypothetical protein
MKILPALRSNIRSAITYLHSNWRSIALCTLIIILVLILFQNRNRNRFVPVRDAGCVLDTRTGQYCNPAPQGIGPDWLENLPRCSDLAKSWR